MAIYLHSNPFQPVKFERNLPEEFSGPFLRGSIAFHYAKDEYKLIIQEIISDFYILRLNVFRFLDYITLHAASGKEGVHSRLMLEGQLKHKVKGAGKIVLRENEYTVIFAAQAKCECIFEKDTLYKTLDIFYDPEILFEFTEAFPQLSKVMSEGKVKKLVKSPAPGTPAMKDIIKQILECPFDENTRRLYLDLKIREYLFLILQNTYHNTSARYSYTPYERECILNAEKILIHDLAKKPLSLRELAKAAFISEYKLKEGFREIFGMSVFDYLQEARMIKARTLLIETDEPLKSICVQTGYARITSFITAFRRRFGYTPGSLRRQ